MKKLKLLLMLFVIMGVITGYAQDLRKTIFIHIDGYSEATGIIKTLLTHKLQEQGKYKILTDDDIIFNQIKNLFDNKEDRDLSIVKKDNIDALVYVEVIDSFNFSRLSLDGKSIIFDSKIVASYKLLDISTGKVIENNYYSGRGSITITNNPYVIGNSIENANLARREAASDIVNPIIVQLNSLFKIQAEIKSINGRDILINAGRNMGIYNGMIFGLLKDGKLEGKIVVRQVGAETAKARILVEPESFKVKRDTLVYELPASHEFRGRIGLDFINYGLYRNGGQFTFATDNYDGLYFDMKFGFSTKNNDLLADLNFNIGYIAQLESSDLLATFGVGYITNDFIDNNGMNGNVYFKGTLTGYYNINKSLAYKLGGSYIFELSTLYGYNLLGNFSIFTGFEFKFD